MTNWLVGVGRFAIVDFDGSAHGERRNSQSGNNAKKQE
jgi:hypothetical protein